jgi:hypothetical protein
MAEKHYTFLVNNRVENTLVFAEQDDELAARICKEQNYDKFIWLDDAPTPTRWSEYVKRSNSFIDPTPEYLVSIGVLSELPKAPTDPVK